MNRVRMSPLGEFLTALYQEEELRWMYKQFVEQLAIFFETALEDTQKETNPLCGLGHVVDRDDSLTCSVVEGESCDPKQKRATFSHRHAEAHRAFNGTRIKYRILVLKPPRKSTKRDSATPTNAI